MKNKVKIICSYFGPLPSYIDLWMYTCGNNPDFDFMLVTDETVTKHPGNVQIYKIRLAELTDKIRKIFDFEIELGNPYKLCDYKPIFGSVFAHELEGYLFWGHCDLDMLWGNLGFFITDEILDQYDIVGNRGALILYRNSEYINKMYLLDGGVFSYRDVFTHAESYGFDEFTGMNRISKKNNIHRYNALPIADALRSNRRLTIRSTERTKEFFCVSNGRIYRVYEDSANHNAVSDEYVYLHMSGKKLDVLITEADYHNFYVKGDRLERRTDTVFNYNELERENEFISLSNEKREAWAYKRKRLFDILFKYPLPKKIILARIHLTLLKDKLGRSGKCE